MRPPKMTLEENQSGSPKTVWSTILTATPVILTVLATVLAGLSSRELTLSQYHRALAAQNQSKAGDQWNFFQAKRSRRTNHENTNDVLQAQAECSKLDAAALEANARFFLERFRRAEAGADHLLQLLGPVKADLGTAGTALQQAAMQLRQTVREKAKQAESAQTRMQEVLARSEVRSAWPYLTDHERPNVQTNPTSDVRIQEAKQAIHARLPEEETIALFRQISEDDLRKALAAAESNVQAMERAYDPISEAIGQIEKVIDEQVSLARPVQRAIRDLEAAASDLPEKVNPTPDEVPAAVAALARCGQVLRSAADALGTDFKAARHAYHARRYKDEADYNRQSAELYEVQVRKSSVLSERHRDRSKNFFYAMLAAQAGVTIATFALAVKHKSILWALASLAGLGAILFGLYAHLYM